MLLCVHQLVTYIVTKLFADPLLKLTTRSTIHIKMLTNVCVYVLNSDTY